MESFCRDAFSQELVDDGRTLKAVLKDDAGNEVITLIRDETIHQRCQKLWVYALLLPRPASVMLITTIAD
ncbi:hypothetical protein N7520_003728 [Penicillium odoratum]|uniref:uncharacterized protein n=1 Tax=Penicillium odoratum TaxID=1167516 RepID=UPI0025469687|nr:uncharacterized protein N7520_003728 [Penicillium odoratum]KAJ5769169.1 hypothetical protein N7520_003728 [Penicillium odoratum]